MIEYTALPYSGQRQSPHHRSRLFYRFFFSALSKAHSGTATILVDELDADHHFNVGSALFFFALIACSTILLIASARDGTSICPRRQSSTIRKKESETRIWKGRS
jgi:hypothetical protein